MACRHDNIVCQLVARMLTVSVQTSKDAFCCWRRHSALEHSQRQAINQTLLKETSRALTHLIEAMRFARRTESSSDAGIVTRMWRAIERFWRQCDDCSCVCDCTVSPYLSQAHGPHTDSTLLLRNWRDCTQRARLATAILSRICHSKEARVWARWTEWGALQRSLRGAKEAWCSAECSTSMALTAIMALDLTFALRVVPNCTSTDHDPNPDPKPDPSILRTLTLTLTLPLTLTIQGPALQHAGAVLGRMAGPRHRRGRCRADAEEVQCSARLAGDFTRVAAVVQCGSPGSMLDSTLTKHVRYAWPCVSFCDALRIITLL